MQLWLYMGSSFFWGIPQLILLIDLASTCLIWRGWILEMSAKHIKPFEGLSINVPWQYYSIGIDATVALHGIQFFLRYSPTNSADWFSFNMLDMKRLNPGNVCKAYQAIISKQGNIHDMQFCIEHAVQGTAANEMLILHRIWWSDE